MGYDVIILGGGVNGLGTARDCAQRGLSVLLLEKGDLAGGASGGGSALLHGGPRALREDPGAARRAREASAELLRAAPHLMARVPLLQPFGTTAEEAEGAALLAGAGATRLTAEALYRLEPGLRPGLRGALRLEEWVVDPWRLAVATALSARAEGAEVRTWTEAREVLREEGRVTGVRWLDALTGDTGVARAGVVLDATGAWSPGLAARCGATVRLRPSKGVHLVLEGRRCEHVVAGAAVDGRPVFACPRGGETWIGATATDSFGDPDDLEATHDEVAYLLDAVGALLPATRQARVTRATWALRATPRAAAAASEAPWAGHALLDHAAEGAAGLLSLVGGRLAWHRAQAEEATDRVLALLGRGPLTCRTREVPLPGGEAAPEPAALAARFGVPVAVAAQVVARHGATAQVVLGPCLEDPRLRLVVCREAGLLAAEVVHCARHELVRRLRDLRTRCRLAVGACGGLDCARVAAQLCARELGWGPAQLRHELADLLEVGWRERRAVLDGPQLAQEELLRGAHWGVGR